MLLTLKLSLKETAYTSVMFERFLQVGNVSEINLSKKNCITTIIILLFILRMFKIKKNNRLKYYRS